MGSTGTGRFTDYSDNIGKKANAGKGGGSSGEDRCEKAFSTPIEDIERCSYYKLNKKVPPKGTEVIIVIEDRICVKTTNKVIIGYLPTKFNYLIGCIENGFSYSGMISNSSNKPIVIVQVDIAPSKS